MNEQALRDGFNHMSFKQFNPDLQYMYEKKAAISMLIEDLDALDWREYCLGTGIAMAQHIQQGLKDDDYIDVHSLALTLEPADDNYVLTASVICYSNTQAEEVEAANTPE